MVKAYIDGISCISAQNTIDENWFFETLTPPSVDYFNAIEPSYKEYIAPNALRRMGRAIKMGVTSANLAIKQADIKTVDAIITGTGLGCFEDTERFLLAILNNDEQFLTPTSFIQSTHNTVGSQIALIMKCHHYNFTYVHRGFSFESCLQDAMMLFNEGKESALVGGIEEHTPNYVDIYRRAKKLKECNPEIPFHESKTKGFQIGEATSFFVLNKYKSSKSLACLLGVQTLYKPSTSQLIVEKLTLFLSQYHLTLANIDVTLMGFNSDIEEDKKLQEMLPKMQQQTTVACFKNACGEFHTTSAFALWTGIKIIEKQHVPSSLTISVKEKSNIQYVLIINQYLGVNYSFMLLAKD